jgi:hypothetical protein
MTAISLPIKLTLGAPLVHSFPKTQYAKIVEIINKLNAISSTSTNINADTITEVTSAAGVTVDGLVIKDSRLQYNSTGYFGVTKTGDATLTVDETGFIFGNKSTALVLTLPATVAGYSYFVVNINGSATISLSPNSSDYIGGAGLTKVDNKDLIIPAVKGAYAQIIADGVNGWYVAQASGTLTKEA